MDALTNTNPVRPSAELARALRANRQDVADAIALAYEDTPKWKPQADAHRATREYYLAMNFHVYADYLIEFFGRGDVTFKHLFVGESIKSLYDPTLDDAASKAQTAAVLSAQHRNIESLMHGRVSSDAWELLESHLNDIERTLTADAVKTQRVLLVGDCLFLDIVPYIVGELLDAGIRLVPDYAASKNIAALGDQLRGLSAKKFDLVFFSPLSYRFSSHFGQFKEWRRALMRPSTIRQLVQKTWDDTRRIIDLLADLFDCPIHVHNSAFIIREENEPKRLFKLLSTARVRAAAKQQLNALISSHVQQKNGESFLHLFVFDEDRMVQKFGEFKAGTYFYKNPIQHPAMMGRILAPAYADLIFVNAWMLKKKVVVCDLDNTLWAGVIGEGSVSHFHDRQATLKALKEKGVVLAINSKNDPANVHWRGGTLSDEDFVCAAISWGPKVHGMKRIQEALNLKTKDYVFVDDREDEREMVRLTYPEVLCLDATDPVAWRRLALWQRLLEEDPDMDRTLMYKQREARKAFIKDEVSSEEERAALYASLKLKMTISRALPNDLKRVAELINRTNQFNLEGSRTSFKEVSHWHESADHLILLGQTSDRFGDMGTTCVAVVRFDAAEMRLLPFVLSCRVFGYGIERGMMNHLKQLAGSRGVKRIVGRYVPTSQNAPCKDFLGDNGFVQEGDQWVTDGTAPMANAAWLDITTQTPVPSRSVITAYCATAVWNLTENLPAVPL
jgi:FkbH-like protein